MSYSYYTLDRLGNLQEEYKNFGCLEILGSNTNLNKKRDVLRISRLFNTKGLSLHGVNYSFNAPTSVNFKKFAYSIENSKGHKELEETELYEFNEKNCNVMRNGVIEWTFELIRQLHFGEKPSRLQSIFGWSSLENLQKFALEFSDFKKPQINKNIYILETNKEAFTADMNLLHTSNNFAELIDNAFLYWNQKPNPFGQEPLWEEVITLTNGPVSIKPFSS